MRINELYSNIGLYNLQAGNDQAEQLSQNKPGNKEDPFAITDRFESSADMIATDFGGYGADGRLTAGKSAAFVDAVSTATVNAVQDFSSEPVKEAETGYAVEDVAGILGTDERGTMEALKENGLDVEDLVDSDKVQTLSDKPEIQTQLKTYADDAISAMAAQTGMNNLQMENFINSLRN